MTTLLYALPGNEVMAGLLAPKLGVGTGKIEFKRFPDGESYVRFHEDVAGADIVLLCTLNAPDEKFLPLYFAARTARDLGAQKVLLVAPYLAYMRQDRQFHAGEGVTSRYFAALISGAFDGLVTVDPHLHRIGSLDEIYSIPTRVVSTASAISRWICEEVKNPVLIGPDGESEQWVALVAKEASAPYVVLTKSRRGDRDVEVSVPDVERWRDRTPVLVDDIISTGRTLIATAGHLKKLGFSAPVCVGIHAVCSTTDFQALLAGGVARVVTSNTVPHESNALDVSDLLVQAVRELS